MITRTLFLAALLFSLSVAAKSVDAPLLKTDWKGPDLATACEKAEKDADAALAKLVAIADAKRTFADSFEAVDAIVADYVEATSRLSFMMYIHPDAAVRDAGAACEERAGKYMVALSARKDLYLAMKGYLANAGDKDKAASKLDAQAQRLIELTMLDFKRSGLELSDADREKLVAIRQRTTELQTRFQKNLNEDKSAFEVKTASLVGLPQTFLEQHASKENRDVAKLTTKYPDYYPVMENATQTPLRRQMEVAFMNRGGAENRKLLDEAVALRSQAAKLLGYKTHQDYVTEDRMAKSAATVSSFITRMRGGLAPALGTDLDKMKKLKAPVEKDEPNVIRAWDWRYYMNQIKKNEFSIDDEEVRSYFPTDKVLAGMFQVYGTVLGIDIKEVKGAKGWADGVKLYEVKDKKTKERVAKFYMDFWPRDGKYGHAAEFTLSSGRATKGGYRIPVACLVLNFPAPTKEKPSHLSMDEVKTLFHEFGHVMHESLTTARYASQAGTRTALDFVEAPSQMLENWAYQPEVLALISQDPKDAKKSMPEALANKLAAARKYNAGVHYSRQLFLGSFDSAIHTADKSDSDAVAKKLWLDIMKMPEDKDAHFAGTFGHMMGGYDGGYYGYLWSEVFAADMFTRFAKEGIMNPATGKAYRDMVLARGRTVEPTVLLKDFLGREPSEAAFLTSIGVKPN